MYFIYVSQNSPKAARDAVSELLFESLADAKMSVARLPIPGHKWLREHGIVNPNGMVDDYNPDAMPWEPWHKRWPERVVTAADVYGIYRSAADRTPEEIEQECGIAVGYVIIQGNSVTSAMLKPEEVQKMRELLSRGRYHFAW